MGSCSAWCVMHICWLLGMVGPAPGSSRWYWTPRNHDCIGRQFLVLLGLVEYMGVAPARTGSTGSTESLGGSTVSTGADAYPLAEADTRRPGGCGMEAGK